MSDKPCHWLRIHLWLNRWWRQLFNNVQPTPLASMYIVNQSHRLNDHKTTVYCNCQPPKKVVLLLLLLLHTNPTAVAKMTRFLRPYFINQLRATWSRVWSHHLGSPLKSTILSWIPEPKPKGGVLRGATRWGHDGKKGGSISITRDGPSHYASARCVQDRFVIHESLLLFFQNFSLLTLEKIRYVVVIKRSPFQYIHYDIYTLMVGWFCLAWYRLWG